MFCKVTKKNKTPMVFDELGYGDIFITQDETVPYMKIEQINDDVTYYNAICLMDGTSEWFEAFDRVFKYEHDIVLNFEDFIGDEGEG